MDQIYEAVTYPLRDRTLYYLRGGRSESEENKMQARFFFLTICKQTPPYIFMFNNEQKITASLHVWVPRRRPLPILKRLAPITYRGNSSTANQE